MRVLSFKAMLAKLNPPKPPGERSMPMTRERGGRGKRGESPARRTDLVYLFGVDADRPYTRIDGLGLVPALDGCKIVALSAEGAILETPGGVRQSYRRKPEQPGRVLVWKLGS